MNREQIENREMEIDLLELWRVVRKNILAIILVGIIFAVAAAAYSFVIATPLYQSTSKLYILGSSTSITSLADIQLGSSLTNDYREMIIGRPVVTQVNRNLNLEYKYDEFVNLITVETPADTRIVKITVTTDDPEKSRDIANELAKVSRQEISNIMDTDPPSIAERAIANHSPVKPEKTKNIALGFILGLILSAGIFIVKALLNDTVRNRDDVEKSLGLTLLAEIPLEGGKKGIALKDVNGDNVKKKKNAKVKGSKSNK